jgi:hypothetical protein
VYYFAFNLGLTIFNKRVLLAFPFPWSLTAIHALAGTIGSQLAHANGLFSAARLSRNHSFILVAFSILYTVNIAVSNLSLHLVTVPVCPSLIPSLNFEKKKKLVGKLRDDG